VITDARAEKAIHYLAETDEAAAIAKVETARLEDEIKATKAAIVLRVEGSVAVREALAETHENTKAARKEYYDQLLIHERYYNRRKTEERITELWRSVNSNRRHGTV
jgi:hypothetical protein